MARLLPTHPISPLSHRLRHRPIPDRRSHHLSPMSHNHLIQSQIAHLGDHHGLSGQLTALHRIQRDHSNQLVPIHPLPLLINEDYAIRIPVMGQPKPSLSPLHRLNQLLWVFRSTLLIDIFPIRLSRHHLHLCPHFPQNLRSGIPSRPMPHIHYHSNPL